VPTLQVEAVARAAPYAREAAGLPAVRAHMAAAPRDAEHVPTLQVEVVAAAEAVKPGTAFGK
jgi:hypothetical protein